MSKNVKEKNGELYVSGAGVILVALNGWRIYRNPKCQKALERYCQYLAMHGYGKGSKEIWNTLEWMDGPQATQWIESSFERYVADKVAAVEYVLGQTVARP